MADRMTPIEFPMVARLVYKDWLVHRPVIITYTVVLLLFAWGVIPANPPIVIGTLLAMVFAFATAAQDERSHSHMFLNSLPVSRREIVAGKYAFCLGVGAGFPALTLIAGALSDPLPARAMLSQFLVSAAVVCAFISVFLPMYYWLGARFVQLGMFVFFISLFGLGPIAYNVALRNNFWGILEAVRAMPALPLQLAAAVVVIGMVVVSWRVSVWLYRRKEF